jgi:hypothetical protein
LLDNETNLGDGTKGQHTIEVIGRGAAGLINVPGIGQMIGWEITASAGGHRVFVSVDGEYWSMAGAGRPGQPDVLVGFDYRVRDVDVDVSGNMATARVTFDEPAITDNGVSPLADNIVIRSGWDTIRNILDNDSAPDGGKVVTRITVKDIVRDEIDDGVFGPPYLVDRVIDIPAGGFTTIFVYSDNALANLNMNGFIHRLDVYSNGEIRQVAPHTSFEVPPADQKYSFGYTMRDTDANGQHDTGSSTVNVDFARNAPSIDYNYGTYGSQPPFLDVYGIASDGVSRTGLYVDHNKQGFGVNSSGWAWTVDGLEKIVFDMQGSLVTSMQFATMLMYADHGSNCQVTLYRDGKIVYQNTFLSNVNDGQNDYQTFAISNISGGFDRVEFSAPSGGFQLADFRAYDLREKDYTPTRMDDGIDSNTMLNIDTNILANDKSKPYNSFLTVTAISLDGGNSWIEIPQDGAQRQYGFQSQFLLSSNGDFRLITPVQSWNSAERVLYRVRDGDIDGNSSNDISVSELLIYPLVDNGDIPRNAALDGSDDGAATMIDRAALPATLGDEPVAAPAIAPALADANAPVASNDKAILIAKDPALGTPIMGNDIAVLDVDPVAKHGAEPMPGILSADPVGPEAPIAKAPIDQLPPMADAPVAPIAPVPVVGNDIGTPGVGGDDVVAIHGIEPMPGILGDEPMVLLPGKPAESLPGILEPEMPFLAASLPGIGVIDDSVLDAHIQATLTEQLSAKDTSALDAAIHEFLIKSAPREPLPAEIGDRDLGAAGGVVVSSLPDKVDDQQL